MSPREHGEVFVLDDGGEVDLDLGNYERYLNITLTRENNITTGKMYQCVIERERKGEYLGKTVQIVPHLTDAIQNWIERVARKPVDDTNEEPDVCIIELGGTVGDIESGPFIEAMRQLRRRAGKNNFIQIHVSLVPSIHGELKTKPTQAAIRDVRSLGMNPDLALDESTIQKIALYCDVERDQVIRVTDVASLYHVPLLLESQSLIPLLSDKLALHQLSLSQALVTKGAQYWNSWKALTISQDHFYNSVTIALVGKYLYQPDAYHSVLKSLEHAAMACAHKLNLVMVDAEDLEKKTSNSNPAKFHKAWHQVYTANGLLVPGGFGMRGSEGIIAAIQSARESGTPFLGICLGMQLAVVEYARHVCGMPLASSEEFQREKDQEKTRRSSQGLPPLEAKLDESHPDVTSENYVIVNMEDLNRENMGGTMRLGLQETHFQPGSEWSKMRAMYQNEQWKPTPEAPPGGHDSNLSLTNGTVFVNGRRKPSSSADNTTGNSHLVNGDSGPTINDALLINGHRNTGASTPHPPSSTNAPPHVPLIINERHRHAYEVNPALIARLTAAGRQPTSSSTNTTTTSSTAPPSSSPSLSTKIVPSPFSPPPPQPTVNSTSTSTITDDPLNIINSKKPPTHELHFVGKDASGVRMEILELKNHPWFVGVQYHPEYLSRVLKPSKPYLGFVAAAAKVLGTTTTTSAAT